MEFTQKLLDACDKVNIDMINSLGYGDEIELNDTYTIYHYSEEDIIVINQTDEWNEVLQVLIDGNGIIYENLI
jgi:hypothetical protein